MGVARHAPEPSRSDRQRSYRALIARTRTNAVRLGSGAYAAREHLHFNHIKLRRIIGSPGVTSLLQSLGVQHAGPARDIRRDDGGNQRAIYLPVTRVGSRVRSGPIAGSATETPDRGSGRLLSTRPIIARGANNQRVQPPAFFASFLLLQQVLEYLPIIYLIMFLLLTRFIRRRPLTGRL